MTQKLDKIDWKILSHLCEDSRTSHQKIAKLTRTNKNSVSYRIKRLERLGIISKYITLVDIKTLGATFYTILIKLNTKDSKELTSYLKKNDHISVIDEFIGRWNFLVEFTCKDPYKLFEFLKELKEKFSDIIDTYEIHPNLDVYNIEQMPIELIKKKPITKKESKRVSLDKIETRLLEELNKNSNASLIQLADKLNVNYKTIASKIKKLKELGVIEKFTAAISLGHLGYDVYLITLDFKNLSNKIEHSLKAHLSKHKNIRASFTSAAKPKLFVYLAVKSSLELQDFLEDINNEFSQNIVDQEYFLSTDQIKLDLFPKLALE